MCTGQISCELGTVIRVTVTVDPFFVTSVRARVGLNAPSLGRAAGVRVEEQALVRHGLSTGSGFIGAAGLEPRRELQAQLLLIPVQHRQQLGDRTYLISGHAPIRVTVRDVTVTGRVRHAVNSVALHRGREVFCLTGLTSRRIAVAVHAAAAVAPLPPRCPAVLFSSTIYSISQ